MSSEATPLAGLSKAEAYAARAVSRVTGAIAMAHDIDGRQNAVDVVLQYPDGRSGALEVTSYGDDRRRQAESILASEDHNWPNPGAWFWSATVADARVIPRLRECYGRVIELCEAHLVGRPELLPANVLCHEPEARWVAFEDDVDLEGLPTVPSRLEDGTRFEVQITAGSFGAVLDLELEGLPGAVTSVLVQPKVTRRLDKLARHRADERHLFVHLTVGGVPNSVFMAIGHDRSSMPARPPAAPSWLTHIWLATAYTPRLILWQRGGGWTEIDSEA